MVVFKSHLDKQAFSLQNSGRVLLNYTLRTCEYLRQAAIATNCILFPTGAVCTPSSRSRDYTSDLARALQDNLQQSFFTEVSELTPVLVFG
ncbi:hypothetical protein EON65_43670 [archaeon]|nr:MAG: hypothetical protein EON65_43670 [archaeon]